jgi:hypothetical protein
MSLDITLKVYVDTGGEKQQEIELFSANITHNLTGMAEAAEIYKLLWCPEELGIKEAGELIEPLKEAIEWMDNNSTYCKSFNAKNGWGTYEQFVPWLIELLDACELHPRALVEVWK